MAQKRSSPLSSALEVGSLATPTGAVFPCKSEDEVVMETPKRRRPRLWNPTKMAKSMSSSAKTSTAVPSLATPKLAPTSISPAVDLAGDYAMDLSVEKPADASWAPLAAVPPWAMPLAVQSQPNFGDSLIRSNEAMAGDKTLDRITGNTAPFWATFSAIQPDFFQALMLGLRNEAMASVADVVFDQNIVPPLTTPSTAPRQPNSRRALKQGQHDDPMVLTRVAPSSAEPSSAPRQPKSCRNQKHDKAKVSTGGDAIARGTKSLGITHRQSTSPPTLREDGSPNKSVCPSDPDSEDMLTATPKRKRQRLRPFSYTPESASSSSSATSSSARNHRKKSRRSLTSNLLNQIIDSASDVDTDGGDSEEDDAIDQETEKRTLRYKLILEEEEIDIEDESLQQGNMDMKEIAEGNVEEQGIEPLAMSQENADLEEFTWSEDFTTFSAQEETYVRSPGPCISVQDPVDAFLATWDKPIMNLIVEETNRYAWQLIAPLTEEEGRHVYAWDDITVEEMYRYFAVLILMSLCYRSRLNDYWKGGVFHMPNFRKLISRNRFLDISRFLHFVDNDSLIPFQSSYDKKICKIRPILDHCNEKFAKHYTPNKYLSLDESLLLWKGRLSWSQCICSKAARFGIKSFDLCEAETGYQLGCLLYTGQGSAMHTGPLHGFKSLSAKVVLKLMERYLDVGHTLVMDSRYNQLSLTRYLKKRRTDVVGTLNRRQVNVPSDIKYARERRLHKGERIARHCGDISLVMWQDVRLVTAMSTYHNDEIVAGRRAGEVIHKPALIQTYNRYMGGVGLKDKKLSSHPMERKRDQKWYIKVFNKLLNTSILNSYIVYSKNVTTHRPLSHREFRNTVALGLLKRFPLTPKQLPKVVAKAEVEVNDIRLRSGNHFPALTAVRATSACKQARLQKRCVRCLALGKRTMVTFMCTLCDVALCAGTCWAEYHTLKHLH